jgi:hypothetical protein
VSGVSGALGTPVAGNLLIEENAVNPAPASLPTPLQPADDVAPAPRDAAHQRHPIDPAEESAAGEEDPGAGLDVMTPPRAPTPR